MAKPISGWNVRGINDHLKAKELGVFRGLNYISCLGLFETKVRANNYDTIRSLCCPASWSHINNYSKDPSGRIWVMWDPVTIDIQKIEESDQFVHCKALLLPSNQICLITFVYTRNAKTQRLVLWEDLKRLNNSINLPWCVLGDFKNVFFADERRGGEPVHTRETEIFKDCLVQKGLVDHKASRFFFTWSNSSQGNGRIQSRIDRFLMGENSMHLFFECPYSKEVWLEVKNRLSINTDTRNTNWEWWSILKMS
ncbi:hypothetical protein FRX31_033221 [Thalictrum thalictroides]|uniref:Uncharacterized protein n=1 Tax=Thalictrum thalictroides TaxID=46969 RepID=A0A7J6UX56_THATH|nr:hypothetical protein FRX31_033221 [Thalictrum thalictroides]